MARPLRIEFAGALYHVMSRGNERQVIVRDDADRHKRLDWLRRTVETYGWRLHAFVLMNNHDHLFVETPEANLSTGMQHYNGSYTGYFNRRHRRAGHLFQGRFKGHLIEDEGYFLEVSRYIHLNPVRARLVERPAAWPWGSCPGYVRAAKQLEWITYGRVLGEFGRAASQARRGYSQFLRAAMSDPPVSPFEGAFHGLLLGSSAFVDRVRRMLAARPDDPDVTELRLLRARPPLDKIVSTVAEHFQADPRDWVPGRRCNDAARAVAAYLGRRRFGYAATEVAAALGYRDHSSTGRAVLRVENGTPKLQATAKRVERQLLIP
ncbi:MAG: transposase [Candidatus Nealsonbacteria bacterium]|nr:transposase [Candidatus Nealsonbacteria bacterium]